MTNDAERGDAECRRVRSAVASGSDGVDWQQCARHLATCDACAPGLARLTTAIQEQFAVSRSLEAADGVVQLGSVPGGLAAPDNAAADRSGRVIEFPLSAPVAAVRRSRYTRRLLIGFGSVAAALLLLIGVVALLPGGSSSNKVAADRRPEFVPSLEVLPARADHTYVAGEQIQVCLRINQPSRVHLSVLQGKTTFDLYDADTSPGEHCFPEQVGAIQTRATLRVDVFYGTERVAREDFVLLPGK